MRNFRRRRGRGADKGFNWWLGTAPPQRHRQDHQQTQTSQDIASHFLHVLGL